MIIERACARAGFVPRVVARASDFAVLLSLVAADAGVTLVPGLAARLLPPGIRLVPPAEPVTCWVFTVSRRGGDRKPACPRRPGRAVRRRLLRGRYPEQGAESVGDRGGNRRHRQLAQGSSRDVPPGHDADHGPEGERRDPADDHRGDHRG